MTELYEALVDEAYQLTSLGSVYQQQQIDSAHAKIARLESKLAVLHDWSQEWGNDPYQMRVAKRQVRDILESDGPR